jgi:hypothetical protein
VGSAPRKVLARSKAGDRPASAGSLRGSQAARLCARQACGAEHLVTGSDYPFVMDSESYAERLAYSTRSDLPRQDVEQMMLRPAATVRGRSSV